MSTRASVPGKWMHESPPTEHYTSYDSWVDTVSACPKVGRITPKLLGCIKRWQYRRCSHLAELQVGTGVLQWRFHAAIFHLVLG